MSNFTLSSLQNPNVKQIVRLQQKASARKEEKLFVIEGRREVSLALKAGIKAYKMIICEDIYKSEKHFEIDLTKLSDCITPVTRSVYEKMAYRGDTQGIIMVAHQPQTDISHLHLTQTHNPIVIVLESVEKPGNLGSILRIADAAGINALIVCDPQFDVFNPNVIRSGIGCLFSVPLALCTNQQAYDWLVMNKIKIISTSLQASNWYHETDLTSAAALVFGSESNGLSHFWYEVTDVLTKIPMLGQIDSLNVAASVAVMVFEAQRQRGFAFK